MGIFTALPLLYRPRVLGDCFWTFTLGFYDMASSSSDATLVSSSGNTITPSAVPVIFRPKPQQKQSSPDDIHGDTLPIRIEGWLKVCGKRKFSMSICIRKSLQMAASLQGERTGWGYLFQGRCFLAWVLWKWGLIERGKDLSLRRICFGEYNKPSQFGFETLRFDANEHTADGFFSGWTFDLKSALSPAMFPPFYPRNTADIDIDWWREKIHDSAGHRVHLRRLVLAGWGRARAIFIHSPHPKTINIMHTVPSIYGLLYGGVWCWQ